MLLGSIGLVGLQARANDWLMFSAGGLSGLKDIVS